MSSSIAALYAMKLLLSAGLARPGLVPARLSAIGWHGDRKFQDEPVRLDGQAFPEVLAAFGSPADGVPGLRRSHLEALYARKVAQLMRRQAGSVTRYDDVALAALASAGVEQARAFVATELGQLGANDDNARRLSATLRIYLEENMSHLRASQRLGVHDQQPHPRCAGAAPAPDRAALGGAAGRAPTDQADKGRIAEVNRLETSPAEWMLCLRKRVELLTERPNRAARAGGAAPKGGGGGTELDEHESD
jgi:hypothetical protein